MLTLDEATSRCWAEVDLGRLRDNYRSALSHLTGGARLIAVLKANAYGLGGAYVARFLRGEGQTFFAAASFNEAAEIRAAAPDADVLVLGLVGGGELEKAIETWGIDLSGRMLLDIGSSTGGFTDCALKHGAARVIAIDVGTDQMVEPLRSDPRVELHEQTDFRSMPAEALAGASIASIDVSFISVRLLVDAIAATDVREVICLVKPQFECGLREAKARKGVVASEAVRQQAVADVREAFEQAGFTCTGVVPSPIAGGDGNLEFLADLAPGGGVPIGRDAIDALVRRAHAAVKRL